VPKSKGGSDDTSNLAPSCKSRNNKKSNFTLVNKNGISCLDIGEIYE
jgi:hypothetical protein